MGTMGPKDSKGKGKGLYNIDEPHGSQEEGGWSDEWYSQGAFGVFEEELEEKKRPKATVSHCRSDFIA